jgi:hypothetical protein
VEHGVGGRGRKEDHQQDRDRHLAGEHGQGQQPHADGPDQVGGDHQLAAVGPVGHRPARQRKQQPRQGQGHPDRADPARILGKRCGQQWRRRDRHPSPRLDAAAATSRIRRARDRSMGQFTTRPQEGPRSAPDPDPARLAHLENPADLDSTRWPTS